MTPAFDLVAPRRESVPLVLESPHSGTDYPEDFRAAVGRELLRQAEDSYVDQLYASGPDVGATLITARFPYDLPRMIAALVEQLVRPQN